jgi:hypothetical protein
MIADRPIILHISRRIASMMIVTFGNPMTLTLLPLDAREEAQDMVKELKTQMEFRCPKIV